jgi:hypothetical protein
MTIDLLKLTAPDDKISSPIKFLLMMITMFLIILLVYGNLIIKYVLTPMKFVNFNINTGGVPTPDFRGKVALSTIACLLILIMYSLIYKLL